MPPPCPNCGYDLKGLPTKTCPECGHRFDPRTQPDGPSRGLEWAFLVLAMYPVIVPAQWHALAAMPGRADPTLLFVLSVLALPLASLAAFLLLTLGTLLTPRGMRLRWLWWRASLMACVLTGSILLWTAHPRWLVAFLN